MANNDHIDVDFCRELTSGDAIEAYYKNTLVHRGPVTDTAPDYGLVWILDTLTGDRRLLDLAELEIVRIPPRYREVRVGAPRP